MESCSPACNVLRQDGWRRAVPVPPPGLVPGPSPAVPGFRGAPCSLLDLVRLLRPGPLAGPVLEVVAFAICRPSGGARVSSATLSWPCERVPTHPISRRRCHGRLRQNHCFVLPFHVDLVLKGPPRRLRRRRRPLRKKRPGLAKIKENKAIPSAEAGTATVTRTSEANASSSAALKR